MANPTPTATVRQPRYKPSSASAPTAAWLEEGVLLTNAHLLAGIPGVLIHGRFDLGSPLENAWLLAQAWPDARLVVVDDSGHTGSDTMRREIFAALDGFAGSAT